jgi:hypothetical protein
VDEGEPRVLAFLTVGALKELLYQAVTLGLAEESADVLSEQMYRFLSRGYLRVGEPQQPRPAAPRPGPQARRRGRTSRPADPGPFPECCRLSFRERYGGAGAHIFGAS